MGWAAWDAMGLGGLLLILILILILLETRVNQGDPVTLCSISKQVVNQPDRATMSLEEMSQV